MASRFGIRGWSGVDGVRRSSKPVRRADRRPPHRARSVRFRWATGRGVKWQVDIAEGFGSGGSMI